MLDREAEALRDMLQDKDFRRTVMQELASGKDGWFYDSVNLVATMLIRKGIPRQRGMLHGTAYVTGIIFGLALLKMKGEKDDVNTSAG